MAWNLDQRGSRPIRMSAVQSRAEKAAEHSRSGAPPGSKSIAYECTPPRCLQTCTDEPRERIKYAVPLKEQKPCCGADTSPASHFPCGLRAAPRGRLYRG